MSAQNADIEITIRGSSARTMQEKAAGLNALAGSLIRMNGAMVASGGGANMGNVTRNISRYSQVAGSARGQTDAFGTSLNGAGNALDNFGTLFSRMVRIMASYFLISTVISMTKDFVTALASAPAKMELWSTQLRALIGNATLAAEKMELLKTVAIETPLELPDLFQGLTVLQAFRVEVSEHTLPLIADLAAVSGRTFADVSEVIGKVIAGSAPAITRSLPTMGIDPNEFKKLAAELGSRSEAIFQIIEEKFGGFARESTNTVIGVLSKIKDTFFVILADIGSGLLPVWRTVFGGIANSLQDLRQNQSALEDLRIRIRMIVDGLVVGVQHVIKFAQGVWDLVQALGGLKSILEVIAGFWLGRFVVSLATGVATLNPWTSALVAAGAALAFVNGRLSQHENANQRAVTAQKMFTESLHQTNEAYRQNINMVNAADAAAQSRRLAGFAGQADLRAIWAKQGDVEGIGQFMKQMNMISGELPVSIQPAIQQVQTWLGVMSRPGGQNATVYGKIAEGISQMAAALRGGSVEFKTIATEASVAAKAMSDAFVPAVGELTTDLKKVGDHDIVDSLQKMREAFYDLNFMEPANIAMARVTMSGLKNPSGAADPAVKAQAIAQLKALRMGLVDEAGPLLGSQNPLDVEIGLKLIAKVTNIDTMVNGLEKQVKDPISEALESALRNAVQRGADAFADALGAMFSGEDISASLKAGLGAVLNVIGDALIQLGLAQIAMASVVQAIRNLVGSPAAGVAAVAAGIALKAFASGVLSSAKSATGGGGGGFASAAGPASFAPFSPSAPSASAQQTNITIQALDAQSAKQWVEQNPDAFAPAIQHVKRKDTDTGGSAYGVFGTQRRYA